MSESAATGMAEWQQPCQHAQAERHVAQAVWTRARARGVCVLRMREGASGVARASLTFAGLIFESDFSIIGETAATTSIMTWLTLPMRPPPRVRLSYAPEHVHK